VIDIDDLSDTQRRALREIAREAMPINVPMGGHGRGPILSACRALVRRGVLRSHLTGRYTLVDDYREMAKLELARWRERST
jgi:hypothetical protein